IALLAIGGAEGHVPSRHVVNEAGVEHILGLIVEAALAELVLDLAIEPGIVHEHAGVGQAQERQRRRHIELDAPNLAITRVPHAVDIDRRIEIARIIDVVFGEITGVVDLDDIADVTIEEIDADDAGAAQAVLPAEIDTP